MGVCGSIDGYGGAWGVLGAAWELGVLGALRRGSWGVWSFHFPNAAQAIFVRKMDRPSLRFKTKSRLCAVWAMNSTSSDSAGRHRACPNVACGAGFAGADCQVSPDGRFISQTPHKRVFVRKMDLPSLRFKTKSRLCGVWEMNSTSSDLAGHRRACPSGACGAGFAGADCQVSPDGRFISQTPHRRVFVRKMDRPSLRFKTKSRLCGVW